MLYFLYMKYVVLSNFYCTDDILELLANVMFSTLQAIVGIVIIPFDILLSPIELITFLVWKRRNFKMKEGKE